MANIYRLADDIEGGSDAKMRFRVTLSEPGLLVSVVGFSGVSATGGNDDLVGAPTSALVMFDFNETENILEVDVAADTRVEGDETIAATILSGGGYFIGADATAVAVVRDEDSPNFPAPDVTCTTCAAGAPLTGTAPGIIAGDGGSGPGGIRYFDGLPTWSKGDLVSDGYGTPWGLTRTYSPGQAYQGPNWFGNGVQALGMPFLYQNPNNGNVLASLSSCDVRVFEPDDSVFGSRSYLNETLTHNPLAGVG